MRGAAMWWKTMRAAAMWWKSEQRAVLWCLCCDLRSYSFRHCACMLFSCLFAFVILCSAVCHVGLRTRPC